jgi:hypothetical protein
MSWQPLPQSSLPVAQVQLEVDAPSGQVDPSAQVHEQVLPEHSLLGSPVWSAQTVPHAPQLLGSTERSSQPAPMPQSCWSVGHAHWLESPLGHAEPSSQVQSLGQLEVEAPSGHAEPSAQEQVHWLFTQSLAESPVWSEQTVPQPPQFDGSLEMSWQPLPQFCWPSGQAHWVESSLGQTEPSSQRHCCAQLEVEAPSGQSLPSGQEQEQRLFTHWLDSSPVWFQQLVPQPPQLFGSVVMSTQPSSHWVWPLSQAEAPVQLEVDCPSGHALPSAQLQVHTLFTHWLVSSPVTVGHA